LATYHSVSEVGRSILLGALYSLVSSASARLIMSLSDKPLTFGKVRINGQPTRLNICVVLVPGVDHQNNYLRQSAKSRPKID
jgi:hypothetical protein